MPLDPSEFPDETARPHGLPLLITLREAEVLPAPSERVDVIDEDDVGVGALRDVCQLGPERELRLRHRRVGLAEVSVEVDDDGLSEVSEDLREYFRRVALEDRDPVHAVEPVPIHLRPMGRQLDPVADVEDFGSYGKLVALPESRLDVDARTIAVSEDGPKVCCRESSHTETG